MAEHLIETGTELLNVIDCLKINLGALQSQAADAAWLSFVCQAWICAIGWKSRARLYSAGDFIDAEIVLKGFEQRFFITK